MKKPETNWLPFSLLPGEKTPQFPHEIALVIQSAMADLLLSVAAENQKAEEDNHDLRK